ncbi:hypothetical protein ACROYT_G011543 [Oculina patagonica]
MFRYFELGLVIFLTQLIIAVAFLCNDNNCEDCVNSRFIQCRWCKRDNKCRTPFADAKSPCSRAETIVQKSHCADEVSRYDPELSMKMLLLSAVAYDPVHPQECLDNSLSSDKFKLQTVVSRKCDIFGNECSGFVAVSRAVKAIVIAFRGSVKTEQAIAEFFESLLSPETEFLKGKVQSYWKRSFEELWQSGMEAEVKALVSKYPSYQIWVTGHSLGAALASLASTWLAYYNIAPPKNIILYTFGMPRVGDYDYALQHDQLVNNSWRVVNDNDLIPHFPIVIGVPKKLSGPYHHGVEVFYSEEAISVNSTHRECHGKPINEDATCSFSEKQLSIERHLNYFSVEVGSFWLTNCVHRTTRKKPEAAESSKKRRRLSPRN